MKASKLAQHSNMLCNAILRQHLLSFALFFFFLTPNTFAGELPHPLDFQSPWKLVKEKEGIQMYTRPWKDSKFVAYKIDTILNTSLKSVVSVLDDIESYPQWASNCSEAVLLEQIGDIRITYTVIDTPVISDRDMITQGVITQDPETKIVSINYFGLDDYMDKQDDRIRMTENEGSWTIIPLKKNQTRVIWQAHANPGGSVPAWLANWGLDDVAFETLTNLKEIVKEDKYQNSNLRIAWLQL